MKSRKRKIQDSGGSHWTSFSDLFTTIAILFLVMFFVLVLQQAIMGKKAASKAKDYEDFLNAKIPKEEEIRAKKATKNLEKNLSKMQNYQEIVTAQMDQLNNLQNNIVDYQENLDSLLRDNKLKSITLNKIKVIRKDLEEKIKEETKKNGLIDQKILKLTKENSELNQKKIQYKDELDYLKKNIDKRVLEKEKEIELLSKEKNNILDSSQDEIKRNAEKSKIALEEESDKNNSKIKEIFRKHDLDKQSWKKDLEKKSLLIANLQDDINSKDSLVKKVELDKKRIKENFEQENTVLSLEKESTIKKLKKDFIEAQNEKDQLLDNLNNQIQKGNKYEKVISSLEDDSTKKNKAIEQLNKARKRLKRDLRNKDGEIDLLNGDFNQLESKLKGQKNKNDNLSNILSINKDEINEKEREIERIKDICKKEKDELKKLKQLSYEEPKAVVCEKPKAIVCEKPKDIIKTKFVERYPQIVKSKIADNLYKRFGKIGLNVELNRTTGTITLRDHGSYLFSNDSHKLSSKLKENLQKAIPILSEELFSKKSISSMVKEITIIGHSSPRYLSKPIDPNDLSQVEAYQNNLRLSSLRALTVTNYIFGKEMNGYLHKEKFRSLTRASGSSYSQPQKWRSIKEKKKDSEKGLCGEYSCKWSRRVEISFQIKEAIEKEKLDQLLKDIK